MEHFDEYIVIKVLLGVIIGALFGHFIVWNYIIEPIINWYNKRLDNKLENLRKQKVFLEFRDFFNFKDFTNSQIEYQNQGYDKLSLIIRNSLNQIIFEISNDFIFVNIEYYILYQIEHEYYTQEDVNQFYTDLVSFLGEDLKVILIVEGKTFKISPKTKSEDCQYFDKQHELQYYYSNIKSDTKTIKKQLSEGKLHLSNPYQREFIKLHDVISHQDFRLKISEDKKYLHLYLQQGVNGEQIQICGFNNNHVFEQGEIPSILNTLTEEERNYKYLRFLETKVITCYNKELLQKVENICRFRKPQDSIVLEEKDLFNKVEGVKYMPKIVYSGTLNSFYFPDKKLVDVSFIE